jgi:hypothetical protein
MREFIAVVGSAAAASPVAGLARKSALPLIGLLQIALPE